MAFVACGLNHKTAPINVREKIAVPLDKHQELLRHLVSLPHVTEAALLSTCNRTEIYCDTNDPAALVPWLVKTHQLTPDLLSHFYMHQGHQGIRHTLRVASGLDSMMLGEPQILGQMKQAYQQACQAGTVQTTLRNAFEYIFSASKRVRSQSGIGTNAISVAYAAVQLISQLFNDYQSLRVFLIGSGETATLVAKYLYKQGVRKFCIASRTPENAQTLATVFAGIAVSIADIPLHLCEADVVISATNCPLPFINKNLVTHALAKRPDAPMFFLDLAVPRDIEANVADLDNVYLYNIDDLKLMSDKGMDERRLAALQAEQLIDSELTNYIKWHRSLRAKEAICEYRQQMQALAQQELQRSQLKLAAGFNPQLTLTEFCDRLVNKLIHVPTVGLRQAAKDGREELLDFTQYLFQECSDN